MTQIQTELPDVDEELFSVSSSSVSPGVSPAPIMYESEAKIKVSGEASENTPPPVDKSTTTTLKSKPNKHPVDETLVGENLSATAEITPDGSASVCASSKSKTSPLAFSAVTPSVVVSASSSSSGPATPRRFFEVVTDVTSNATAATPLEEVAEDSSSENSDEREERLLAEYESSAKALGDGESDSVGDPPLTMEDSTDDDSEPEASAGDNSNNFENLLLEQADEDAAMRGNRGLPLTMEVDSDDDNVDAEQEDRLAEYEAKVILGSDFMLHHRRLPSIIYEESATNLETTPLSTKKGGSSDLPLIESRPLNLPQMEEAFIRKDSSKSNATAIDSAPVVPTLGFRPEEPPLTPPRAQASADFSPGALPPLLPKLGYYPSPTRQQCGSSHPPLSPPRSQHHVPMTRSFPSLQHKLEKEPDLSFMPLYSSTKVFQALSARLLRDNTVFAATWIGFWALFNVTCVNYVLTPLRDAIAIKVGVKHIPVLTLASTGLAFVSSVPIGWLFEAPDPSRRKLWKHMGLTRGETQGTSLALFYRCFAVVLISYAVGFTGVEWLVARASSSDADDEQVESSWLALMGKAIYVAFFLVVHLMKLHSLSLVWGVTTEAMEYEEVARKKHQVENSQTRLQRLARVGFGGTLGGIIGSGLASSMARILRLPGLLILAAILLEVSAELSIELGRIMQKHWETQQLFQSSNDLASLDTSMKRSVSMGSMKRVASGNSLSRVKSATDLAGAGVAGSVDLVVNDGTFAQRLMRGVTTILRSRLLMAIFTYNALYASTTVMLSFQRAELVANRDKATSAEADTAFLANINMASSIAIFALQASGTGALLAHKCGPRWTLSLMPLVRLAGVLSLAWWHRFSRGQPPNLLVFLVVDECCKIMNLAVAKPVRESLWRGLSNEARYEAKPIVDTLANRWGGGSSAFLVSFIHHTLDWFGDHEGSGTKQTHERALFGFPPILFLCMVVAAWWTAVSADLGHIRSRIDLELKKRQ